MKTRQVNVRLTDAEREELETVRSFLGIRGIAALVVFLVRKEARELGCALPGHKHAAGGSLLAGGGRRG